MQFGGQHAAEARARHSNWPERRSAGRRWSSESTFTEDREITSSNGSTSSVSKQRRTTSRLFGPKQSRLIAADLGLRTMVRPSYVLGAPLG